MQTKLCLQVEYYQYKFRASLSLYFYLLNILNYIIVYPEIFSHNQYVKSHKSNKCILRKGVLGYMRCVIHNVIRKFSVKRMAETGWQRAENNYHNCEFKNKFLR